MPESLAIRTRGLTKRYGSTLAVDRLDLDVRAGEVFGFLGPNGAGKSTTIKLLLGLARATEGSALVLGADVGTNARRLHRRMAYVSGDLALWPQLTGGQTLDLLGRLHGSFDNAYRQELIELFALDPTKRVRSYSKGNRQKVGLIAALMTRAPVLVLDEPTVGLDPLVEREFRRQITAARANGQTVFLSSHILSEVEAVCDRVGILRSGRLVDLGTLAELRHLSSRSLVATFPGSPPRLDEVPGVTAVSYLESSAQCTVVGSMAPLLSVLAAHGATALTSREPTLEEIFLRHYGDDPRRTRAPGA